MSTLVEFTTHGEVATITLNRPEAGNRLTNAMAADIGTALARCAGMRAIVLRGAGGDFCLGRDMQPPPPGADATPADVMREDAGPMIGMFDAFSRCTQPLVCVVQGRAWGIGTVFAALCDVTFAASDATFRLAELERGIPPCIAMSALIDRMPAKALAYLVYSAETMDAKTALASGIASRIVEAGTLGGEAEMFLEKLFTFAPQPVAAVKAYLEQAPRGNPREALQLGARMLCDVLASR
jgi:enoyl-CoA hydratase/carnithine racemase